MPAAVHRVEAEEAEVLRLQATIHESDAIHRHEVMDTERKHRKELREKDTRINGLKRQINELTFSSLPFLLLTYHLRHSPQLPHFLHTLHSASSPLRTCIGKTIRYPRAFPTFRTLADTVSEENRTIPDKSMAGASDRSLSLSELLRTPELFNIDHLEDVDQEINRLEDLAAHYPDLNQNERFRTRFERLQNQRGQLTLLTLRMCCSAEC